MRCTGRLVPPGPANRITSSPHESPRPGAHPVQSVCGGPPLAAIFIIALVILVTAFVVFVERGQRKITVNYAKRQVGNKIYGGQSSFLPLKLNMSGVIPPIFASSIILFPATAASWFTGGEGMTWLKDIAATLVPGQPIYVLLYAAAIVFFCFFYTALQYNPKETAENLKKSGAFIPGIRDLAGPVDLRVDVHVESFECAAQGRVEAVRLHGGERLPCAAVLVGIGQRANDELAAEAGYADQAHLTREVTRLASLPPAALLAVSVPDRA